MRRFVLAFAIIALAMTVLLGGSRDAAHSRADDKPDAQAEFFRKKILPVLKEACFECHSAEADDLKGNLRVDTRDGLRMGGDNGPAVVPQDLEASFLWKTIQYMEDDYKMPPKGKMDDKVLEDFRKWITDGAVDPR